MARTTLNVTGDGMVTVLVAKTEGIMGERQVSGVLLGRGESLSAGMVIVSAGVRPNMALAEPLGIGRSPSAEEIAGWDIDIRPDGLGLPPGEGSVADGEGF